MPVEDLIAKARHHGQAALPVTVAFTTRQAAQHAGRAGGYRNEVVSVRVADAVGSCAVEPGEVADSDVFEVIGRPVVELFDHPMRAIRVAALDAHLMAGRPFATDPAGEPVQIAAGDSLAKSMARARAVGDLLPVGSGARVAVIGVVNSLLRALRERGMSYTPCDLKPGRTAWGEPVTTDAAAAIAGADAVLATGMTLGNGTIDGLLATGAPVVLFAQTGAAIARELVGLGVQAVSAEPYPFFWLTGGDTLIYRYRAGAVR
jgi:hypothetical protein